MNVELSSELKVVFPNATFGSLVIRDILNTKSSELLDAKKKEIELNIRSSRLGIEDDGVLQSYSTYFKRWGRTYPIEFQLETIRKGSGFPWVSVLVDSMFLAEVKNRILTSGHDLDTIKGKATFDVSDEGEIYVKLNGREQSLKRNDVVLRDREGILASVLYGPAVRTSITMDTINALYLAWSPYKLEERLIRSHMEDILENLTLVYGPKSSEISILR